MSILEILGTLGLTVVGAFVGTTLSDWRIRRKDRPRPVVMGGNTTTIKVPIASHPVILMTPEREAKILERLNEERGK